MSDLPSPQDTPASKPVTDVEEERDPTPQGRVGDPKGLVMPDKEESDEEE